MSAHRRPAPESGSAVVEFVWLGVLLLLPLVYVVGSALTVARAAYAVAVASRQAGRAFVTAPVGTDPWARARAAATTSLRDQGVGGTATLSLACSLTPCLSPGARVTVSVVDTVRLPLVPRALGGHPLGAIVVTGRHAEVVDRFRSFG